MFTSSLLATSLPIYFGRQQLSLAQIFFLGKNVYATVNLRPAVAGHVLVISRRQVSRLAELTDQETLDIWQTTQKVSKVMEQIYNVPCQIGVQDGKDAGQTVSHVHIHVIPMQPNREASNVDSDDRPARTTEDMYKEADSYRKYFEQIIL